MKTTIITLCSAILLTTSSCNNTKNESKADEMAENHKEVTASNSGATVVELNESTTNDIVGLWKLHKSKEYKGSEYLETDNITLEIKSSHDFAEPRDNGKWYLSFSDNGKDGISTIFTKVVPNTYSDYAKISTYSLTLENENNVNYLKLLDFKDGRTYYYIRQQ